MPVAYDQSVDLGFSAKVEGAGDISALADKIDELGKGAGAAQPQFVELSAQLRELGKSDAAINAFREARLESQRLTGGLNEASAAVDRLASELAQAKQQTQAAAVAQSEAASALAQARQRQDDLRVSVMSASNSLAALKDRARESGQYAEIYAGQIAVARARLDELKDAHSLAKAEVNALAVDQRAAAAAVKELSGAEKDLQKDYDRSVSSAGKLSAELRSQNARLESSRESLKALGIDSSKLSEAQQQLANEIARTKQNIGELGDRLKVTTSEFSRTEAATDALNHAFRTLGTKPLAEITEETKRLQAALATIRSSGIIGPDQDRAVAAFNARLADLKQQAQGIPPAAHAAGTAINNVGTASESAGNMLGMTAKSAAGLAAAFVSLHGVGEIAKGIVQTGAAFETLEVRLTSLLGSSDAAKEALAQIKQLAMTTPFEVSALAESFTKLTAMGLQPSMTQMRALADTAATLGGGTEALQGVTLALGQAWAKNKLQGDEILQLAERGVPIWDLLAKATGKNIGELQKLSEAGLLGRDTILKLIDAMGEMNSGASDKLMSTFSGAVSNAKDALHEFYDMVAKAGVLEFLTSQVQDLLKEFDRMKASGELQAAAKQMADSLLSVGESVDTAIHAIEKMSGVIKLSAEVWVAWRLSAMTIIPALGSITAATTGAAAASTAAARAATAVAGGNAAVAASAAPVVAGNTAIATSSTAAAVGMTALARAIRLVKGLTLVGLVEGAIELGMEFFRAKNEAEKLDRQLEKTLNTPPSNKLKDEIKLVATETEAARFKLTDYQRSMQQLLEMGKSVVDALDEVVAKADLTQPKGIVEMVKGLDSLRTAAMATAEEIQVGLVNRLGKLSTQDLKDFGLMAEMAFKRGELSASQFGDALDARADAALKRLGVSASVSLDGFSAKFLDAARSLDILIADFDRLKKEGSNASELLRESFKNAINTASSQRDLDDLAVMIKAAGDSGRLAKRDINEFLEQVKKKSDEALPGINSVAEAFHKLGMKTPEELKRTADDAAAAFTKIKESSDFSAKGLAQVREAFQKYAEASIAANGGVASDTLKVQSSMYGLSIETDNAGKSVIRLANANRDLGQSAGGAVGGIRDVAGAAGSAKGTVDALTASLERMAAAQAAADRQGVQGSDGVWRNAAGQHVKDQGGEVVKDKNGKPVTDSTSLLDIGNQTSKTVDLTQWLFKASDSIEEVKAAQKYIGELYEREKATKLTGNVGDSTNYTRLNKLAIDEAVQKALAAARIELATGKQVDLGFSMQDMLSKEMAKVDWNNQLTNEGGIKTMMDAVKRAGSQAENQTAAVTINIGGKSQKVDLASVADRDALTGILRQLEDDGRRAY